MDLNSLSKVEEAWLQSSGGLGISRDLAGSGHA